MNRNEREAFLADVHVGVISIPREGRAPLTAPIWYSYEPGGEVLVGMGRDSLKGRLISEGVVISLCAQDENPPYKYVTVEGPVISVTETDSERDTRPMAIRYLGKELGNQYADQSVSEGNIQVRIKPEVWLTVDYGKL
ncbi:MAG: pyridoxamine 5'-phosphate oxidase [Gammaproteobacteria bacterium]|jgi:nitroimidazol reductase NimA-like FMN-containing flavoprotein (pyridoxamine 5'-phosphate oxidase superfamily)|nr:pyridoxamine 5'-phosphate oxidase [Gammaproteobacteria bacterium]|tara:strand:- start:1884 stop:2297 length:414 start_codon:yes stop_codon:yes gene_type:complete